MTKKQCPECLDYYFGDQRSKYCRECRDAIRKEKACKYGKEYRKNHPNKNKKMSGYRTLRWKVLMRDNFTCQYCGRKVADGITLEVDHIKPRNGKSITKTISKEKLITSCRECNLGKRNQVLTKEQVDYFKNIIRG